MINMLRTQLHIEAVNWFNPKETILIAGNVLNKCKNEFDITGAPQEIAGFLLEPGFK
jgi:hypothetical protein